MKKAAIVVLNFNGVHFLEQFLPTLLKHSPSYSEVIIADNASTDSSLKWLNTHFPQVPVIRLIQNYGYAKGYNEALKELDYPFFVLINSDVEVPAGWLDPLISFLELNPEYAAAQPKILDFNNRDYFEYAGASGGFLDKFYLPYCRGRLFETIEKDTGQYDSICDIHWATGACFIVRSRIYKEMSGFDPDFFAHMEEIDLCLRIRNSGWKIGCVPSSRVYHVGGGTLNKVSSLKTYLNFRNNLYLILKNERFWKLVWLFPFRLILDLCIGLALWKKYSFVHFRAIGKAYIHFLGKSAHMLRKRTALSKGNTAKINLLFSYFLSGKRTFEQLNQ